MTQIRTTYDDSLGPRTVATLEVSSVNAGENPGPRIEISQFGGPLPDGRSVSTSETVGFKVGRRYLVFLTNQSWHYRPWVAPPLRVEQLGGRDALVGPGEQVVSGLEPKGIRLGARVDGMEAAMDADGPVLPVALTPAEFIELLDEAIQIEGIRPNGQFTAKPTALGPDWRVQPTAPAQN